jgi:hypothetical protein
MKFPTLMLLAGLAFGVSAVVGCDDTKSKNETIEKKPDGTVVHDKTETKQSSDGTVTKEEKHTVDNPNK